MFWLKQVVTEISLFGVVYFGNEALYGGFPSHTGFQLNKVKNKLIQPLYFYVPVANCN